MNRPVNVRFFDTKSIVLTTLFGVLSALFLAFYFIAFPADESAKASLLNLGTLEELIKFSAVLFSAAVLGVYSISPVGIAAGFGVAEALIRFVFSGAISPIPLAVHIIAGLFMAIFLTRAFKEPARPIQAVYYSLALLIPIAFHLVYNINIVPVLAKLLA